MKFGNRRSWVQIPPPRPLKLNLKSVDIPTFKLTKKHWDRVIAINSIYPTVLEVEKLFPFKRYMQSIRRPISDAINPKA